MALNQIKQLPQRIAPPASPGALLKAAASPQPVKPRTRQATPDSDPAYLARVRELPCMKCGMEPAGEAAHVRMNSPAHGKRQAMGKRPQAKWCVPLCSGCHRTDADAQHKVGELAFWQGVGINPLLVCVGLHAVREDAVAMRAMVLAAIAGRRR